ncbi:DUF2935 domain-containing protein [Clostridium sp. 19966]|uniref:DUF2935 domain-containing protein n=1 Tax=Clostridium sp. 19966 TaxID=2768166 RepID=UPI0028DE8B2E|nr:DUF2935 domain-containing protein [Clostridium sp. 19966]MDT8715374.1 DUF2935 domain-containing protein [Clostridium sp. 19966]
MLLADDFIRQSLELNLFFLRIMKEHSFFLEAGFTPKNANLAQEGDNFKDLFTGFLTETIALSNGVITPFVKHSGELVTRFTLSAEKATSFYTGVALNSDVTVAESDIVPSHGQAYPEGLEFVVRDLNNRIMHAVRALIDYKTNILNGMLYCSLFTTNYPLLIDHIRREARLYHRMLYRLQHGIQFDLAREAVEQQRFWNRIMAEHAKFIRGLLDPTEDALIRTADNFGNEFDILTAQSIALNDSICNITENDLRATISIRNFKAQGTSGLIDCQIRSIIVPLLGDHTLREANHYLRLLEIYKKNL